MAPPQPAGLTSSWFSSSTQLLVREAKSTNLASPGTTMTTTTTPMSVTGFMAAQWQNPSDILSVLLLLGPDVVERAIAQLAGRAVTPVAFSFGWVAYAVSALVSSFGDGRLMPESETSLTVIDTNSGHGRETRNWVLGRFLRDFNDRLDEEMKYEQAHGSTDTGVTEKYVSNSNEGKGEVQSPEPEIMTTTTTTTTTAMEAKTKKTKEAKPFEALRVTVFEVDEAPPTAHGVPVLDWVWFSGFATMVVQLGIAAVPWAVDGYWDAFLITAAGNALALVGGSLPQWRAEKWACPKDGGDTTTITEGNGSRSAVVVLRRKGAGLKFEVLARGTRLAPATRLTRIATPVLAVLWIMLLVTVAGMQENTWYLLGIGLLGSIQNLVAAGVRRSPSALGIHLKHVETTRGRRVAETLRRVEERYPLVGTSLLSVFFPGSMRIDDRDADEVAFWRAALDARYRRNQHGVRLDRLPPLGERREGGGRSGWVV